MDKLKYIVNILIVFFLFAGIAIQKDGNLLGSKVTDIVKFDAEGENTFIVETLMPNGTRIINSESLAKDVIGFGGRTPVKLFVKDDIIIKVEVLANSETPSFWQQVLATGFLEKYEGMSLQDAATNQLDAVSGATLSSTAVAANVMRAAQYASNVEASDSSFISNLNIKSIIGLFVIALGVIMTFFKPKNQWSKIVQLALNVIVLGFWCGSFLSLSAFTSMVANGVNFTVSLVLFALLLVALIMPLFNKKGTYCSMHCPMGSAQELIGMLPIKKIKIKPNTAKFLNKIRYYLLLALMFIMWCGVGFDLINYEIFSAFIYSSASTIVLIMAVVVLLLSPFIQRPYCRFVCPTGALLTNSQLNKK